jgi:hypothetical protein
MARTKRWQRRRGRLIKVHDGQPGQPFLLEVVPQRAPVRLPLHDEVHRLMLVAQRADDFIPHVQAVRRRGV